MGKPMLGGAQVQTVATGPGGKQTIVINKPGGGAIRTAGGQQIIVVTTAGGMRTVQGMTTTQAGSKLKLNFHDPSTYALMIHILALILAWSYDHGQYRLTLGQTF